MAKHSPFAREHIMQEYLDSLLKSPEEAADAAATTARLLEQASQRITDESPVLLSEPETLTESAPAVSNEQSIVSENVADKVTDTLSSEASQSSPAPQQTAAIRDQLDDEFQALFFDVAGLTLAVPLITLGGIHQLEKVGPLFGKPEWFKGVMLHREEKLNVVDTALWVMPEKYDQNLADALHYRYLVMLGDSSWGLACEGLVNTVTLTKSDVKWRESHGKRPWLAGMVKEKMCALVDVNQLVAMLNNGLGSNDQTN